MDLIISMYHELPERCSEDERWTLWAKQAENQVTLLYVLGEAWLYVAKYIFLAFIKVAVNIPRDDNNSVNIYNPTLKKGGTETYL